MTGHSTHISLSDILCDYLPTHSYAILMPFVRTVIGFFFEKVEKKEMVRRRVIINVTNLKGVLSKPKRHQQHYHVT